MTIDQVKVIEIGSDAIEAVLEASPALGLAYPPKLMHAVVAALGRHGLIIQDRYEEEMAGPPSVTCLPGWTEQPIPNDEDVDNEECPVDAPEDEHLVPDSVICLSDDTRPVKSLPSWLVAQ